MAARSIFGTPLDVLALTLVLAFGGCAAPRSAPNVNPVSSSGIGIEIKLPRLGLHSQEPQIVYFIKFDRESNILQPTVVRSSYAKSGRIYLLNVPPGSYAAVAVFHYRKVVDWPGNPAPVRALGGRLGFVTYLSDEMVMKSIVHVKKDEVAFAGRYVVGQKYCCKHADATQLHFADVLSWQHTRDWPDPERIYSIDYLYTGTMREAYRDEAARAAFSRVAKEDLGEDWSTLIK